MKKEMTMTLSTADRVRILVQNAGESLAAFYSDVMEEKISVSQAWKILNASASLVATVFFPVSIPVRLLLTGWFLYALWGCKRSGLY